MGGEKWILQLDSNIAFFHNISNVRRTKNITSYLDDGNRVLTQANKIKEHIIICFYKNLFGSDRVTVIHFDYNVWTETNTVTLEDNDMLTREFTEKGRVEIKHCTWARWASCGFL
jgi:hypothetical protein